MNQCLTNSIHGVLQVCQFILVYAQTFCESYAFMYAFMYIYINWESLAFFVFLQRTARIVLFCGIFFTLEIEKSLTLNCIKLCVAVISLRDGCRTLQTYKMLFFVTILEMLWVILNNFRLEIQSIILDSFIFMLACFSRKHRREVLWNVHYFWALIGYRICKVSKQMLLVTVNIFP